MLLSGAQQAVAPEPGGYRNDPSPTPSLLLLLEKTGLLVWGESTKMVLDRQGAEDAGAKDDVTQPVLSRLL